MQRFTGLKSGYHLCKTPHFNVTDVQLTLLVVGRFLLSFCDFFCFFPCIFLRGINLPPLSCCFCSWMFLDRSQAAGYVECLGACLATRQGNDNFVDSRKRLSREEVQLKYMKVLDIFTIMVQIVTVARPICSWLDSPTKND